MTMLWFVCKFNYEKGLLLLCCLCLLRSHSLSQCRDVHTSEVVNLPKSAPQEPNFCNQLPILAPSCPKCTILDTKKQVPTEVGAQIYSCQMPNCPLGSCQKKSYQKLLLVANFMYLGAQMRKWQLPKCNITRCQHNQMPKHLVTSCPTTYFVDAKNKAAQIEINQLPNALFASYKK